MPRLAKKKNDAAVPLRSASQDVKREAAEALQPYDPCCGLVPVDYRFSPILVGLTESFESEVEQFLRNADPDAFNGSFMDARISAALEDTLANLRDQQAAHRHTIEGEIAGLWDSVRQVTVNKLRNTDDELEKVERELEKRVRIMTRGTAYDEDLYEKEGF